MASGELKGHLSIAAAYTIFGLNVVLCTDNRKDVDEIPDKYLKGLRFHYVREISEVIEFALL